MKPLPPFSFHSPRQSIASLKNVTNSDTSAVFRLPTHRNSDATLANYQIVKEQNAAKPADTPASRPPVWVEAEPEQLPTLLQTIQRVHRVSRRQLRRDVTGMNLRDPCSNRQASQNFFLIRLESDPTRLIKTTLSDRLYSQGRVFVIVFRDEKLETTGIEPATPALQRQCSPN